MRNATRSDKEHRRGLEDVPEAWSRALRDRVVGAAAIAFGASVAIENAVLARAGAPAFGDPIEEVLAHYHNRGAVAIAVGLVAVYLPLLLVFVTGLHGLVGRRGGAGADWSRRRGRRRCDLLGDLRTCQRSADRARVLRRRAH